MKRILLYRMRPLILTGFMVSLFSINVHSGIEDGLIVYHPLDDMDGVTASDASGNDHNGSLIGFATGGTEWVAGKTGNGLELGGGYVEVSDLPTMESTTWAAWVRVTSESPFGAAISATFEGAAAGHSLGFHSGGNVLKPRILWNHNNGFVSLIAEDPVVIGEWNHLALTYDAGEESIILYVNGEQALTGNVGTTPFSSINLGRREASQNSPLDGALDDVAIFDRPLTPEEIMSLFNGDEVSDGLVLNWALDETSGETAEDASGNDHHGQVTAIEATLVEDWTNGRVEGALDFAKTAHVATSGFDEITDTTWSIWVNLHSEPSFSAAMSATFPGAGAGHSLGFHTGVTAFNPRILWNHANGHLSIISPDPVQLGEWNHLLMTYDATAGEAALFVNGEEKGRGAVGTTPFNSINLGRRESSSNSYINGILDEARVYNRVLSLEEINELTSLGAPSGPPEIINPPVSRVDFAGSTGRFEVIAEGALPLRYLWFKGEEPLRDQTESVLVIPNIGLDDGGSYSVRVSNDEGEITSASVSLEVTPVEGIATGRQGFWSFNETEGLLAADSSQNGNDGALENFSDESSHWVDAQNGNGLAFDGAGSLVGVPNSTSLSQLGDEATFAFWINASSYGEEENTGTFTRAASFILSKGGHYHIKLINDPGSVARTLAVRMAEGNASSGVQKSGTEANAVQSSFTLDTWQHWAIVYKNSQIIFYQNGFRIGDPEPGNLGAENDVPLTIGDFDGTGISLRSLAGILDELGIWARPLSEEEILDLAGIDTGGAPEIASQSGDRKRLEGSSTMFEVFVSGKRPLNFQWQKDGKNIEGATSSTYTITKITGEDAGSYSVIITNSEGQTTSQPITLDVEILGDVTSGLVAYYPFDENQGTTLNDASGNKIHGELQNFEEGFSASGIVGGAFTFDGLDDFIIIDHKDPLNLTDQATVSVWLNPVSVSNNGDFDRVLRKDVNFDFVLINGGVARVHGINKTPYSSPGGTVDNGTWQHFAYTFKGGQVQWYKNGQPVGNPIPGSLGAVNNNPLVISNFQPNNDIPRLFEGDMDELGIWQRALSPAAIAGIYENGLRGKPLNVEFEPLNIRSVDSSLGKVSIIYFTPFENRDHEIVVRSDLNQDAWLVLPGVETTNPEPGLYIATFDAPVNGTGFYWVSALTPPPLFEADFESATLDGWEIGGFPDNLWEAGTPANGPGSAFAGTGALATDLDGNFVEFTDAYIRTPTINLEGVSSATLSFQEWFSVDDSVDFHQIIVNVVEPGAPDGDVITELSRNAGTSSDWTPRSLRLSGDATGQNIQIEFRLVTDDFSLLPGWYIDNLSITAD